MLFEKDITSKGSYKLKYQCVICKGYTINLYQPPSRLCSHYFCKSCYKSSSLLKCPIDLNSLSKEECFPIDLSNRNPIYCKCPGEAQGCQWEGAIKDYYKIHEKSCYFLGNNDTIDIKEEIILDEDYSKLNKEIDTDIEIKVERVRKKRKKKEIIKETATEIITLD